MSHIFHKVWNTCFILLLSRIRETYATANVFALQEIMEWQINGNNKKVFFIYNQHIIHNGKENNVLLKYIYLTIY